MYGRGGTGGGNGPRCGPPIAVVDVLAVVVVIEVAVAVADVPAVAFRVVVDGVGVLISGESGGESTNDAASSTDT